MVSFLLFLVYHLLTVLVERRALGVPVLLPPVLLVALTRRACCLLVQVERGLLRIRALAGACQRNGVGGLIVRDGKKAAKSPPAASVWRARRDTAVLLCLRLSGPS